MEGKPPALPERTRRCFPGSAEHAPPVRHARDHPEPRVYASRTSCLPVSERMG